MYKSIVVIALFAIVAGGNCGDLVSPILIAVPQAVSYVQPVQTIVPVLRAPLFRPRGIGGIGAQLGGAITVPGLSIGGGVRAGINGWGAGIQAGIGIRTHCPLCARGRIVG